MYAHTKIDLIDQSNIPGIPQNTIPEYKPLIMCAITSDKGDESLRIVEDKFSTLYGEISFERHGQALLQAARIIENEGKILVKRIVASDAKLANITFIAKTKKTEVQKTDSNGNLIYLLDGVETAYASGDTIPPEATPVMIDTIEVKYELQSVQNISDFSQIKLAMDSLDPVDVDGYTVRPLFTIYDIGRGVSEKKFRISQDYEGSKNIKFLRYKFYVLENGQSSEEMYFSFNNNKIYIEKAFDLENIVNKSSNQVRAKMYDDNLNDFVKEIYEVTGVENILDHDILAGTTKDSIAIENLTVDLASANITSSFGIGLPNGDNGAFGDSPVTSDSYEERMSAFFSGELDDNIYDYIKYPVEAVIDANYSVGVKRSIENFVSFREDVKYFGDMGLGISTIDQMRTLMESSAKNKFCSYYHLSYDVQNPYSKKPISVTVGYSLAKILPRHLKYNRNKPLAGVVNSAILEDAIDGTVNFIPKKTPLVNQKQELDDIRCNYAGWLNDQLVLETQYTSQEEYTQLSFINNVLMIQQIIRAVRNRCPITRYSFIDGEDLETYKKDVQRVLDRYTDKFKTLTFEYIQDDIYVQNKIFYAAIKVEFRNYVQAEYFKIYAIG